jgi:hypothetical protein
MSWVPLAGSAIGTVCGGFLSDYVIRLYAKRKSVIKEDGAAVVDSVHIKGEDDTFDRSEAYAQYALRMCFVGVTNVIAIPMVALAFVLNYPYCFVVMIFSGWV